MPSRRNRPLLFAAALIATAGLAGCAYQDPLSLPPLGPSGGASPSAPPYGYGGGYYDPRYGAVYPYGRYPQGGYYDPRTGYYYAGNHPGYYGPVPYPPPGYRPYPGVPVCVDANRDGRCDHRRGNGGDDHNGHGGGGNGNGGGGGQGPGVDPRQNPFEQVREITRRAERSPNAAPAPPAVPSAAPPTAPQPPRTAEPRRIEEPKQRTREPRRAVEPKRSPTAPTPEAD